ncbi:General transcriptional corepressor ssn6 [Trichoderma lentiforme]|uniref:General transcriptional corepressor ssn6 n=1 Tax=Trichoderma lentiforme TaxID=1567552 RepID=A0A9P4XDC2_9HYPO|nr:General transcriptional corepressor ssn6 [Trichoderma lentiforme]
MAIGGTELGEFNWKRVIKPGLHIEQAMVQVVTRAGAFTETCLRCSDVNSGAPAKHPDKPCSTCGRWVGRNKSNVEPVVRLLDRAKTLPDGTTPFGPELPSMQLDNDFHHFRRVQIRESSETIHDINTAKAILSTDSMDPAANTFLALRLIQEAQDSGNLALLETPKRHLKIAISSDSTAVDPGYLLAEISMLQRDYTHAHEYLQQAAYRSPLSPQIYLVVANMYYHAKRFIQSREAISHAIQLTPYFYMPWYNLGILWDARNRTEYAYLSFERCLELNPDLPDVRARLNVLAVFRNGEKNVPDDYKIHDMLQCELMAMVD